MKKVMLAIGVIALGSCVQNTSSKVSDVNVKDTIVKDTIVIVKDTNQSEGARRGMMCIS